MIERYKLPNGLGVILELDKNSYSAAASVWVKAGSMLESKEENGLSHFMEHMAFKGTFTRMQNSSPSRWTPWAGR